MNRKQKMMDETRDEWRELGFYFSRNDKAKEWVLTGSPSGLMKFCEILRAYVKNDRNAGLSAHDHLGPYTNLKIMTWSVAGLNDEGIQGSLGDLLRLSALVQSKLETSLVGDSIIVSTEYTEACEYQVRLNIMNNNFDPASPDPMEWAEKVAE